MSISISAISSINYGYTSYGTDYEYERIKMILRKFGIEVTNNREIDMTNFQTLQLTIIQAQQEQEQEETQSDEANIPWADFMSKLGLTPTGDPIEDYDKALTALEEKLEENIGSIEREEYEYMLENIDETFNVNTDDYASMTSKKTDFLSASSYISELNKAMFVN